MSGKICKYCKLWRDNKGSDLMGTCFPMSQLQKDCLTNKYSECEFDPSRFELCTKTKKEKERKKK